MMSRDLLKIMVLVATLAPGSLRAAGPGDVQPIREPMAPAKSAETTASKTERLVPPFVWGADSAYKMQVGGEVRARVESRKNYDFDRDIDGDDTPGFLRTKINFDLTYRSVVRAFVEILDGREFSSRYENGQEVPADLHQAYLEFPLAGSAAGPWSARVGRQELSLGRDRRLVDASGWANLRQRFDGVDFRYRTSKLDADLFVVQPNYYQRRRGDETITDRGRRRSEEFFYGGYLTARHFEPHTLEAYFLGLTDQEEHRTFNPNRTSEDGTYGSSNRYTVGSALYGPLHKDDRGELSYTVEGAYQFGRSSKDSIGAWFLRGDTTYKWNRPWKPSLALVGTWASGDRDPQDGRAGRFDPLFGTSHSPYGIMDFVKPRNLRELALVGSVKPTDKLTLEAQAHAYWLDSKTDVGPQPPGQSALRDKTGRSGRSIGEEISLTAEYKFTKRFSGEIGAAHFFAGSQPTNLGRGDGASFFYLQTKYEF